MFAVIKAGGKQYRVAAQDTLKVDRMNGEPGEIVQFGEVLVLGGEGVTLGTPTVAGASVAAEVLEQGRGPKVIAFKKRRRKNSRRKRGSRAEFTLVRITEILTDGKAPTLTKSVRRDNPKQARAEAAAAGEEEGAAPAKPKSKAAKKPAAKSKGTKPKGTKSTGAKSKGAKSAAEKK